MEAVVNHSLKRSLETQKHNLQTERTQIFTARGGEDAITLILSLVAHKATCLLLFKEPLSLIIFNSFTFALLLLFGVCDCVDLCLPWFLHLISVPV